MKRWTVEECVNRTAIRELAESKGGAQRDEARNKATEFKSPQMIRTKPKCLGGNGSVMVVGEQSAMDLSYPATPTKTTSYSSVTEWNLNIPSKIMNPVP